MNIVHVIVALAVLTFGHCNAGFQTGQRQHKIPQVNPWLVGIYYRDFSLSKDTFADYGSLISNKHVLTYAKMVRLLEYLQNKDKPTIIRIGGDSDYIERGVLRTFKHERFGEITMFNNVEFDIAILELDEIVPFGSNIQPICLPQSPFEDYTGKLATVTDGKNGISVPIWSNKECAKIPDQEDQFTDNMIGAGPFENETRIECNLNRGLMYIDGEHGSMEIIGMYLFGPKCTIPGKPGIYTRVANFVPWIQSKMSGHCMCAPKAAAQDVALKPLDSCDCVCGLRPKPKPVSTKYSWLAAVYDGYTPEPFRCSGALISNKHVLISAKCANEIHFSPKAFVRIANQVIRKIAAITRENYSLFDENDINMIAVLKLTQDVDIEPIALPTSQSIDYTGRSVKVIGWKSETVSQQDINVQVWSNQQCNELTSKITKDMLCVKIVNGSNSDCVENLDNGLIAAENEYGTMEIVGIYIDGPTCGGGVSLPTVYMRIASFLPWVKSKLI